MDATPRTQTLGRAHRLRRRAEFLEVQEHGRRMAGRHYLLFALRRSSADAQPSDRARLGVTVSRKVGGAVTRNRVKRWVRESYRRLAALAPQQTDLVVVARPPAADSGLAATREELEQLLKKLRR